MGRLQLFKLTLLGTQLMIGKPEYTTVKVLYCARIPGAHVKHRLLGALGDDGAGPIANVLFAPGKADLTDAARATVQRIAGVLNQDDFRERKIRVEGFSDATGSEETNQKLSEGRAHSVAKALVGVGVSQYKIFVINSRHLSHTLSRRDEFATVRAWEATQEDIGDAYMVEVPLQRSVRNMVQSHPGGYKGPWAVALVMFLVCSGLCTSGTAMAQRTRPVQIGALTTSWGPTPSIAGLRDGLVALGYREDQQFVMGVRFTQGDLAALTAAARELVESGVDVLIADSDNAAKAAQMATTRIPIVFIYVADPVGLGLIESFARPGGNITGVTNLELELGPKRLEVFQEIVPGLKRVLFPYAAHHTSAAAAAQVNRDAARRLGMELVERPVHTEAEIQAMLAQMRKGEVDGILVALHSHAWNLLGVIMEAASQQGIPTMFADTFMVERGGLASYGSDSYRSGRQAARLVDKILKGGKPAVTPVEMNSDIELTINLKAAKALGLTIPPAMLSRAERLIR